MEVKGYGRSFLKHIFLLATQSIKRQSWTATGILANRLTSAIYRQYTFLIFELEGVGKVIPAEAVYAVFEAKQEANAENIEYAQIQTASVRKLRRTSARS